MAAKSKNKQVKTLSKSLLNERSFIDRFVPKKGIDVSHHQGDIDWKKVATTTIPYEPIRFAYIKITEGKDYADPKRARNSKGANDNKVPFGYYHFAKAGNNTATDEANNFFNTYKAIGVEPTLSYPFMLDIEFNNGLTKTQFVTWIKLFISTFQHKFLGPIYPPIIIYGSPAFLEDNLGTTHDLNLYNLWVAHPNVENPKIPKPWQDWFIWQYTWKDKVNGITGDVDANWAKPGLSLFQQQPKFKHA